MKDKDIKDINLEQGIKLLEELREYLSGETIYYFIAQINYTDDYIPQILKEDTLLLKHDVLLSSTTTKNTDLSISSAISNLKQVDLDKEKIIKKKKIQDKIDSFLQSLSNNWNKQRIFQTYFRLEKMDENIWSDGIYKIVATTKMSIGNRWRWWFTKNAIYSMEYLKSRSEKNKEYQYYKIFNETIGHNIILKSQKKAPEKLNKSFNEAYQKYLETTIRHKVKIYTDINGDKKQIQGNKGHELEAILHGANLGFKENIDEIAAEAKGNLEYYRGADVDLEYDKIGEQKKIVLLQLKKTNASIKLETTINGIQSIITIIENAIKNQDIKQLEEEIKKFFNINTIENFEEKILSYISSKLDI